MSQLVQYTATELARELHLTPLQVGKIFSSMYPSCKSGMNCGMQIKSTTMGISNRDYATSVGGKWFYTAKARVLLLNYVQNFRNVANAIGDTRESNIFLWPEMDDELRTCIKYCKALKQMSQSKERHVADRRERGVE